MATGLYVLHVIGAVVWVGGMAFAILALRPAAQEALEAPQRIALMSGVFRRFFRTLWHVVPLVILSGWGLIAGWYWGFGASIWHVHLMHLAGLVMSGVFLFVALGPWKRMRAAVAAGDRAAAATALETIRKGVTLNLTLGLLTVGVAAWGRFGG
jgi:uncharacterized membrane protein